MAEIKISDLSIGDWVRFEGKPYKVICIEKWRPNYVVVLEGWGEIYTRGIKSIEPIPLTPKILEKNGFEIVDESADFQLYGSPECSIFFTKGTVRYLLETPQASVVCWNVHQLQHALRLAGVEKEIEL